MMSETTRLLIKKTAKVVAPPKKISVSEWAAKYRFYSSDVSPNPGRHNNDRAPYQKEILDCFSDIDVEEVTFVASAQVGKTSIFENVLGYIAMEDPGPTMMVHPRVEDAEDFSKDRLDSMVRDSPALRGIFGDGKSKKSGSTILKKKMRGGFIKQGGANSPASLAARSIRWLLQDEKDRFPISAGKEGNPSSLARKRTNNFHNKKIGNISTPTIKNHSAIEKDWERSDQRQFYLECPHCPERFLFRFEHLKFHDDDPETTEYVSPCCLTIIDEVHKPTMLKEGKWIAAKPFKGHAGFRINELYSPWRKWKDIVKDYLEAKDDPEKMKVFTNTSKGETWEISTEVLDWEKLYARRETYKRSVVPMGGLFLTGAVDVQKNRLEVEVKAWGRGKSNWSIEKYVLYGETNDEKVWLDLAELLDTQYEHESGGLLHVEKWAIDSGYNTSWVYDFVRKYPPSRVYAVKGITNSVVMVSPPKALDVRATGKRPKKGAKVWNIGVDIIKNEFFGNLGKQPPTKESLESGAAYPAGYCHYPEYEEEWFKQLTAEVQAPRKGKNGSIYFEWMKIAERNEAIDLHVYNRAMAFIYGIDRFKERKWKDLEESLNITSPEIPEKKPERKNESPSLTPRAKRSRIKFRKSDSR